MRRHRRLAAAAVLALCGAGLLAYWLDMFPLPEVEDGDYPLRPLSIFTKDGQSRFQQLSRGHIAWLHTSPEGASSDWAASGVSPKTLPYKEVRAYPELKSACPLYGAVDLGEQRMGAGKDPPFYFVIDESQGTKSGYDRLFFDLNHDLDLTNDSPVSPLEDPPRLFPEWLSTDCSLVFATLSIPFDFGPDLGRLPVEVVAHLTISGGSYRVEFVATEARQGKIQMGRHRFPLVLAQWQRIAGRFDAPSAELFVMSSGFRPGVLNRWWGEDTLASLRLVDGKFYRLSATPQGDTLMVRRYRGETGVLRVDAGNRGLADIQMKGALQSASLVVPVGELSSVNGSLGTVRECELPVGDYGAEPLKFRYGRLSFWLTDNYHVEDQRSGAWRKGLSFHSISIRRDKPFVLDFSHRPEVMFVSPTKAQTFKPGDEVQVQAVLVEPVLNAMIRGLDDTSRKQSRKSGDQTVEVDLSLDPTVTICDAAGKKVAEGTMPFG